MIDQLLVIPNIQLPNNIFFKPSPAFLKWAAINLKRKIVIECGAGVGHLSKLLQDQGINVIPIDLHTRDNPETDVLKLDSVDFKYPSNSISIIARPNRGAWIRKTIDNALMHSSYVLYIGLKKHEKDDIAPLRDTYKVEQIMNDAGKENEILFKIQQERKCVMENTTYCLVKIRIANKLYGTYWYQDGGDRWLNFAGGFCPKDDTDKIIETAEAEDVSDLDWLKTDMVDERNDAGWLSRSGRFYGCNSTMHDTVADLVFNKTVKEMEDTGWVRIYNKTEWVCLRRLSPEQRNVLSEKGFVVRDDD